MTEQKPDEGAQPEPDELEDDTVEAPDGEGDEPAEEPKDDDVGEG